MRVFANIVAYLKQLQKGKWLIKALVKIVGYNILLKEKALEVRRIISLVSGN